MPSKKYNQLDAATDAEAKNDSFLWTNADPINGIAKKMTGAQVKEALGTFSKLYTAIGTEGTSLVIPEIQGKQILAIIREVGPIWETGSAPDSSQYTWDDTTIVLGAPVSPNERFNILYRTY